MSWIKDLFVQSIVAVSLFFVSDYVYTNFIKERFETAYRIQHDVYHHTLLPSYDGRGIWGGETYRVCTDSNGFKSNCDDAGLQQSQFDVGFIGDSFTEAIGLPFEDSFVGMFAADNNDLRVANLGVTSYAPTIYYSKIKHLLDTGFTFDHIYVFIDISDIQDESTYFRDDLGSVQQAVIEADSKFPLFADIKKYVSNNFYLFTTGYQTIKHFFFPPSPLLKMKFLYEMDRSAWTYDLNSDGYGDLGVRGLIDKAIQEMVSLHTLLSERNIKLSVGIYPWPAQLRQISRNNRSDNRQVSIWREFCIDRCENFIDLFSVYKNILENKSVNAVYQEYYIKDDVHFNREGNRLIFESLSSINNDN